MPSKEPGERLQSLASSATAITAIIGFVIGLPSLVFTWNNQANERARAFSQAVEHEESRWNKLFDLYYVALADREVDGRKPVAEARFQVLCRLAVETGVPNFGIFPLAGEGPFGILFPEDHTTRHAEAQRRVDGLKAELIKLLETESLSTPKTAACVRWQRDDKEAEPETTRERVVASVPRAATGVTLPPVVAASAQVQTKIDVQRSAAVVQTDILNPLQQPGSVTLSAGKPNGWDIDMFWCEGAAASQNLRQANAAARTLTAGAIQSVPIGRVRLRLLTLDKQRDPGYRPVGLEIRGEAKERRVAERLAAIISGDGALFRYRQSSQRTPWYLSAFVCQP